MKHCTRRAFLRGAMATGAALATPWSRVLGANYDVRVACIGVNGIGKSHMRVLSALPGVRVVAVCDVDPVVLAKSTDGFSDKRKIVVDKFKDVRKLLERNDIDAVTVATPNHWHALIGIWACQALKDVYVESPFSHNVWEGRQLVNAASKFRRIVQCGMQARSNAAIARSVRWVRGGKLGKIVRIRAQCYQPRESIGKVGRGDIPDGVDYDLWTGPAYLKPLRRKRLHNDWRWIHDTGNGELGNQGVHQMDIARWFLGAKELSPRVLSVGGRFGDDDDGETPNTQIVYHDFADAPVIVETRGLSKKKDGVRVLVECEGGTIVVAGNGSRVTAHDKKGKKIKEFTGSGGLKEHLANFVDGVGTRVQSKLRATALAGHLSSALCHTGMISHRLGKEMAKGEIAAQMKGAGTLGGRYEAMAKHLADVGVDLATHKATVGPWLTIDPKTEQFVDNEVANSLLTRNYREPFVVSEVKV